MAETIEETYETAVTRKVVRKSLKIEEVSTRLYAATPAPPPTTHAGWTQL
ncbi:hypothetical protein RR46_02857 [Papilio xuthus]|uniref:Uncharacterized protein n=1 Tax=Papilio xuthus TaxID=66420 RepID=A0A194QD79_PAPXU|nr:hypothetical protein RR46_02857 [Papilio xuthus]